MAFLGDQALPRLASFSPQNLANSAWGFAQLGASHPGLMAGVAGEARRRGLEGFNSQNISDLAFALSAAGHKVCGCVCVWGGGEGCVLALPAAADGSLGTHHYSMRPAASAHIFA